MISRIHLAHGAEALARWPAHNYVRRVHPEYGGEFGGRELGEVFAKGERVLAEIRLEGGDRLRVEIQRRQTAKSSALQAEAEAAATAKKIEKGKSLPCVLGTHRLSSLACESALCGDCLCGNFGA